MCNSVVVVVVYGLVVGIYYRWEDIVRDLSCESPQYFNIRHPERGVLSKNTKRKGTNLHCIMAFKKLSSPSRIQRMEDSEELNVTLSEVEELDSSDSDYPDQRTHQATASPDLSLELEKIEGYSIDNASLASGQAEEVDGKTIGDEPAVSGGLKRSGTFTKEAPSLPVERTREPSMDSEYSVESYGNDEGGAHDHTPMTQSGDTDKTQLESADTVLKRSGTFTKDRKVHVKRTRESSSDYDSDVSNSSLDVVDAPTRMTRSGTFTKESNPISSKDIPCIESEAIHVDVEDLSLELDDTLKESDFVGSIDDSR